MKSFLSLVLLVGLAVYSWVTFKPETVNASPVSLTGRVVGIIDGDSIKFSSGDDHYRIELAGIDAPEIGQAFSDSAIYYLTEMIDGREIRVEVFGKNDYGDIIGEVFLETHSINRLMLTDGYAWAMPDGNDSRSLTGLESLARNKRLGLWRQHEPVAPWVFREEIRKS